MKELIGLAAFVVNALAMAYMAFATARKTNAETRLLNQKADSEAPMQTNIAGAASSRRKDAARLHRVGIWLGSGAMWFGMANLALLWVVSGDAPLTVADGVTLALSVNLLISGLLVLRW